MTENPFEGLGGAGGFDMNALLAQAQEMQEQLNAANERLKLQRIEGNAGAVTVTIAGSGELTDVKIATGAFDGTSAEDLEDLGDLIVAAFRDAKAKADENAVEAFGPIADGGLPGMPGLG
ncbi:YbaB/EbfC family nucleoid-associated protein [Nocardioides gilvus]|uniref:YbaB/EbfC family nucleoid-associated protein n=1 Tax=Nocardioides gilvus TaxID=1735589 RepID=UPI000D744839|nr:YbaB/EbfC family nucleoid-associated protein [Nocardioides gilvus]